MRVAGCDAHGTEKPESAIWDLGGLRPCLEEVQGYPRISPPSDIQGIAHQATGILGGECVVAAVSAKKLVIADHHCYQSLFFRFGEYITEGRTCRESFQSHSFSSFKLEPPYKYNISIKLCKGLCLKCLEFRRRHIGESKIGGPF